MGVLSTCIPTASTMDSRTGEPITVHQANRGVFYWEIQNPLYFKIMSSIDTGRLTRVMVRVQFNHNLRKALGIHKCFMDFQVWTALQVQTTRFLRVFRTQVFNYLNSVHVISVNWVLRAVDHVLWQRLTGTIQVNTFNDIKYNVY